MSVESREASVVIGNFLSRMIAKVSQPLSVQRFQKHADSNTPILPGILNLCFALR